MVMICRLKEELSKSFNIKDLGPVRQISGIEIFCDRKAGKLWLSQEKYVEWVLERFNMKQVKLVVILLANHFKLSRQSCPTIEEENEAMVNIPYSSVVGRYLSNPRKIHWEVMKWILRYLRGISRLCQCLDNRKLILEGFTGADMAGDHYSRKSTSGYLFTFAERTISWQSKLQKCVALSTTEAEYIVANEAGKRNALDEEVSSRSGLEVGRLKKIHNMVFRIVIRIVESYDSTIQGGFYDSDSGRILRFMIRFYDSRFYDLRPILGRIAILITLIHRDKNTADILTKIIPREKLELCLKQAGMDSK
ncbi:hypothetical protein CRG98_042935 [Punica granatum]|uniref:Reverse transcriptase Ty1/copia-type domain-containing protein n=1 Tax=Punica granatum TaxID=22663 RepID=A0A2I0HZK2_PUNGR|nr:hypothetical protein CRG98_042935 [Punica granatum]